VGTHADTAMDTSTSISIIITITITNALLLVWWFDRLVLPVPTLCGA
jgi:hypothetical protein